MRRQLHHDAGLEFDPVRMSCFDPEALDGRSRFYSEGDEALCMADESVRPVPARCSSSSIL